MDPPILITEAARTHLLNLLDMTGEHAILLRVNSKGCGGHAYQMDFIDPDFGGEVIQLDDQHNLIIDHRSLLWMIGMEIDYLDSGLETELVFNNPVETGRCGCGHSFTTQQSTGCK